MAEPHYSLCGECSAMSKEEIWENRLVETVVYSLGHNYYECVHLIRCEKCKAALGIDPGRRAVRWTETEDRYSPGGYKWLHAGCADS